MIENVNICGIPYKVNYYKDRFDMDCHFGQIDYKSCEININADLTPEMMKQSLVHEIVHGMLISIGEMEKNQDETFVQALAMAINLTFKIKE